MSQKSHPKDMNVEKLTGSFHGITCLKNKHMARKKESLKHSNLCWSFLFEEKKDLQLHKIVPFS